MTVTQVLISGVGVLLSAAFLSAVLRSQRPELALGLGLAAGLLVAGLLLSQAMPLMTSLRRLTALGGLSEGSLSVALRSAGVCLVTQLTADTCRDAGESALASKAELVGRVLLLWLSLPLFEQILTLVVGVVEGQAVTG